MSKQQISGLLVLLLIAAAIGSCKHEIPVSQITDIPPVGDTTTSCDPNKIYFQQQVLPILISNCAKSGCHDQASHKEGVILISYSSTMSTGEVRPGRPGNSKLWEVIADNEMPPAGNTRLTQAQKDLIYNWILQGAQNLVCQNACGDTVNVTYNLSVKPIITNKCQGCHSGSNPQGGIDLTTYTNVKAQVTNGKLWGAVNWNAGFSPMPKNGNKLNTCELTMIQKWINQGAPNN
ncbi:MAG: hypothetical protein C4308_10295 [Chitinophagaceae bacterium]